MAMAQTSLSLNIPQPDATTGPLSAVASPRTRTLKAKTRSNLEEGWRKAEEVFAQECRGRRLGDLKLQGKEGVLNKWKEKYPEPVGDPEARYKRSQLTGVLKNVLKAVDVVGAFASQAGSIAFPPAGMCFSAFQFLIDAPAKIYKVYDDLEALFTEVEKALVRVKIYDRILDLDEALVLSTNNILVSLAKVCAIATKVLLKGGHWNLVKNAVKVVLGGDDSGVSSALEDFRRLAVDQNMLTGAVTLEHVMKSEESVNQILGVAEDIRKSLGTVISNSNDEKTRFVLKNKLDKIEERLFRKTVTSEAFWKASSDYLLPGTLEALQDQSAYKEWLDESVDGPTVLAISGPTGSGKTRILEAIKSDMDFRREDAEKDDPSIYVAAYSFEKKRYNDSGVKESLDAVIRMTSGIPNAFRALALQVARQSTTYANLLHSQVSTNISVRLEQRQVQSAIGKARYGDSHNFYSDETDIERLSDALKLSAFSVSKPSKLYIILDAIDLEDVADLEAFLDKLTDKGHGSETNVPQVKVLVSFDTAIPKLQIMLSRKAISIVSAPDISRQLMPLFLRKEMTEIGLFQDSDRATRNVRRDVESTILKDPLVSFSNIRQKVSKLQEAVKRGLPQAEMTSLLVEATEAEADDDARSRIRSFERSAAPSDIVLANAVLPWILCSPSKSLSVSVIESGLCLEGLSPPVETLGKRFKKHFGELIVFDNEEWVSVNENVQQFLLAKEERSYESLADRDESIISVDISIKNATESNFKKFIWDLNEHVNSSKFQFNQVEVDTRRRIHFEPIRSQVKMVHLMFQVLNVGWEAETEMILGFASAALPGYLSDLQQKESFVTRQDRKMIGEGLISYLRDTYTFDQKHQFLPGPWLLEPDSVSAMEFWLKDQQVIDQLPLKEQRWLRAALSTENGYLGFMRERTTAICKQWLTDWLADSAEVYNWIDNYIEAVSSRIFGPIAC